MKKLIKGIVEFRRNKQENYRKSFSGLATGQSPDSLFIACSDSRVVPNVFASTDPGDLFVVRNIGNLIPQCDHHQGMSTGDESVASAIEFAVGILGVTDVIVCGHSECAAMRALIDDRKKIEATHLRNWLQHGEPSVERMRSMPDKEQLTEQNRLSQINVLVQMEHVMSYPIVKERMKAGKLSVRGWWFDITHADVYAYEPELEDFVLIDEVEAERILRQ